MASEKGLSLLYHAKSVVDRHERAARDRGALFNIFDILDRSTDEVKCHSAFIAELLDPRGSHGQGVTFQRLFLDLLSHIEGAPTATLADRDPDTEWSVSREKAFAVSGPTPDDQVTGQVDIVLDSRRERKMVVIENKVYASDQERQLERYSDYARSSEKTPYLVYLTLDGHPPTEYSLGSIKPTEVLCLSYAEDIASWLDSCIEASALLPNLRETLNQYRDLVQRLAGGMYRKELAMDIAKQITDVETLKAAEAIEKQALPAIRATIQSDFWKKLKKRIEESDVFPGKFHKDRAFSDELIATYHRPNSRKKRDYGISFPLASLPSGRSIAVTIALDYNVYFGLVLYDGEKQLRLSDDEGMVPALKLIRSIRHFRKQSEYVLWDYPKYPQLNFNEFNDACVALIDSEEMEKCVASISEEVMELATRAKKQLRSGGLAQ